MKLSRNKVFGIGVAIILLFITVNRVDFIIGSTFTKGTVTGVHKWNERHRSYFAPRISYAADGYTYSFDGEIYSELPVGEEVTVVHKADHSEAEVFSFVGFIMTPMIYALLPLLLLAAVVYSFIGKNETLTISRKGISKDKPFDPESFNLKENPAALISNKNKIAKTGRRR